MQLIIRLIKDWWYLENNLNELFSRHIEPTLTYVIFSTIFFFIISVIVEKSVKIVTNISNKSI